MLSCLSAAVISTWRVVEALLQHGLFDATHLIQANFLTDLIAPLATTTGPSVPYAV